MKTTQQLIEELNNYFYCIYKNNEISTTETYNAINSLLDYQFAINDLNVDDYTINIHLTPNAVRRVSASMRPDVKYVDKYEIFLNPNRMTLKKSYEHSKRRTNQDAEQKTRIIPKQILNKVKNCNSLLDIIFFFMVSSHEFQHIVQFETIPQLAYHSYSTLCSINFTIKEYAHTKHKKFLKLLEQYYDVFQVSSVMEKDADKSAFKILNDIFEQLIENSDDENYIAFLSDCQNILLYLKKDREEGWKIYNQIYKKVSRDMKKYFNLETPLS